MYRGGQGIQSLWGVKGLHIECKQVQVCTYLHQAEQVLRGREGASKQEVCESVIVAWHLGLGAELGT